jgi:hypothetical protein
MRTENEIMLNVLVLKADGLWVAQGVEYDLVAQADTLENLEYEFERVLNVHLITCMELGLEPFETVPPAPDEIRELFWESRELEFRKTRFVAPSPTSARTAVIPSARLANHAPNVPMCLA